MGGPIRALYVAADTDSREAAVAALETAADRLTVDSAGCVENSLRQIVKGRFDCVLSDYELPNTDGVTFLESVRNEGVDVPFILLAENGSEAIASAAVTADVTEYLSVGLPQADTAILASLIREHVEKSRAQRERERLGDAIETAQEGIGILNENGEFEYVNRAYADIYGYEQETLLGNHWQFLFPDEDVEDISENVISPARRTGFWRGETTGHRADGRTFIKDQTISLNDANELICTVRDITEQKADREELGLKTRALDASPMGVVIADATEPDNPLVYANEAFEDLTGYSESEILGKNCRFLQGEGTREGPVEQMREAIAAQEPVSVELRNYRKDGTEFWNEATIAPIINEDGKLTHYVGFQTDVTERKRHEQDLELHREAVEQAGHGVVITDREGVIEYVNPAYERDTGFEKREAIGQTPRLVKSGKHDETFYQKMWETICSGEIWEAKLVNRDKSGKLYHVEQTIAPITDQDGEITHFVGIESDVSQRELRLQRLDVLNRILRHNVRNWMTVVRGNASILQEALDDENLHEQVTEIQEKADELIEMGEKAATVQNLFEGEFTSETLYDIGAMISNLTTEIQTEYPAADVTTSNIRTVEVRADDRVTLAIKEIVDNAIVHSDETPPSVDISISSPDIKSFSHWVDIVISDTGPGIPEHERRAIERQRETSLVHGTGLGLWLVNWLVAGYGGELLFAENDPRGSVVTIRLPTA